MPGVKKNPKGTKAMGRRRSGGTGTKAKAADAADQGIDEWEQWSKMRTLIKPDDQLDLTEAELKEDIPRLLTTYNPQPPDNLVQYSFKERAYIPIQITTQHLILLNIEGTSLHRESEEGMKQLARLGGYEYYTDYTESQTQIRADDQEEEEEEEVEAAAEKEGDEVGEAPEEEKAEVEEAGEPDEEAPVASGSKKLTNQFNFCERAALTYNNPYRDLSTQTAPPSRCTMSGLVTQWIIYDAYQEDYEAQQREKEKEKKIAAALVTGKERKERKGMKQEPDMDLRLLDAVRIMDRMINQNLYDEIAQDYRYWEDPSDQYKENVGTLLPLWKFVYEKTKKNNVTGLTWNPSYYDFFCASFGCFDFMAPNMEGAVCLFTLKNPSYPEYIITTETGVMCVDVHPKYPYLIVVGLDDGNVNVYNVKISIKEPQFKSDSVTEKHFGIVWEVKWGSDMADGELNFYSVASDGQVLNWVLMQHDLARTVIINLVLGDPHPGPDGTLIPVLNCGTAITFHPTQPLIFLVGTEMGTIYKCSTAYASMYLTTYEAHHMPVTKINYNLFNPDIFISSSSDWRIKIWQDGRLEPLFGFDLGSPVGDVQWAPYSSTVFGAVTSDGRVHVFDLNIDKYRPICQQSVVVKRHNKCTRLAFNEKLPIIIVGDERGCITSLKLSPNLRKKVKPPKKGIPYEPIDLEIKKLAKLLESVQEPPVVLRPEDTAFNPDIK